MDRLVTENPIKSPEILASYKHSSLLFHVSGISET